LTGDFFGLLGRFVGFKGEIGFEKEEEVEAK
jgi:hypothetical protein